MKLGALWEPVHDACQVDGAPKPLNPRNQTSNSNCRSAASVAEGVCSGDGGRTAKVKGMTGCMEIDIEWPGASETPQRCMCYFVWSNVMVARVLSCCDQ